MANVSTISESFSVGQGSRDRHLFSRMQGPRRPAGDRAEDESDGDEILTRRQFVRRLQFEKRRADRYRIPMSLVLFRVDAEQSGPSGNVGALLDLLRQSKRETDVLGCLGDDLVGVLLTHTDATGLQGFLSKFASRSAGLRHTTTSGTYPDQVFESIVAEHRDQPDTLPYFLESGTEQGELKVILKRCLDVVGAAVLLVVASPIMLAAALAVKATSPGPVIFSQTRLGRKGAPFTFYKFRSMTTGADESVHRDYVASLIEGRHEEVNLGDAERPIYKLQRDARITPVGAFLRRTSMDELPQLINVLKGDMSLVGPRPPIPYEAERYQAWHLRRVLESRPGITGLWQVEGRNRVSFDDMVRLDLRYARTWSLWLDMKILVRTVFAVVRLNGDG